MDPIEPDDDDVANILEAAKDGDLETMRALIIGIFSSNPEIEIKANGSSSSVRTVSFPSAAAVGEFLGAARADYGDTALHMAEVVRSLVSEFRTDVNPRNESNATPLHFAARFGHKEIFTILVEHGADVGAKDRLGNSPLHCAAESGHVPMIHLLSDAGADAQTGDGATPLHVSMSSSSSSSAKGRDVEIIEALVSGLGADVNAKEFCAGNTALHLASVCGRIRVVRALVSRLGADVEARNHEGKTALHIAAESGQLEIVRALVFDLGAEVDAKTNSGCTALHLAARFGNAETVRALVTDLGADVNAEDCEGTTPLQVALRYRRVAIAQTLEGCTLLAAEVMPASLRTGKHM